MKRVLLITLATLSLWSCSKDSGIDYGGAAPDTDYDPQQVVCFTTETETRGTPITDKNVKTEFTSIGVFGYSTKQSSWSATSSTPQLMFNKKLTRSSKGWVYDGGSVKWDNTQASDKFTFFAYAPYAETSNGITVNGNASAVGTPTLTYTVPSDVTKQPDLMVAVPRKDIFKPDNGFVSLDMRHTLTCVGFHVAGNGEQIKSIAITGVSVSETLSMDGGNISWSATGTKTTADFTASINFDDDPLSPGDKLGYFTATEDMSGTGTRPDFLTGNGYLMMIPQALGTDAKIVLTMSDDTTTEIGLDGYSWAEGQLVNYHITLVPEPVLDVDAGSYTWPVATGGDDDSKQNYPQGVCPKGYRVPTLNELMMMWINYPGTPELNFAASHYWSAIEYGTDRAYIVDFSNGYTNVSSKTTINRVRCVRKDYKPEYPYVDITTDPTNGPIIVSSDGSGGIAAGSIHENWTTTPVQNEKSATNAVAAKLQVANVNYSFGNWGTAIATCPSGWRLPTQRELMLIWVMGGAVEAQYNAASANVQLHNPPLGPVKQLYDYTGFTPFLSIASTYYWSAADGGSDTAWVTRFYDGITTRGSQGVNNYMRCVRDR